MKKKTKSKKKAVAPVPREFTLGGDVSTLESKPHFVKGPWDPVVQKHIQHLIADITPNKTFENADIATEMIVTVLKAVESRIGRGDLKLLNRSMRELRYAFKVFKSYKETRKVSIFGSARTDPNDKSYKMAREFARKLKTNGYMVITGAGPGIMEAGNAGAGASGSFGVNIRLPYEQHPNKFIGGQPTYIDCRYFFTRKLLFVKEAAAGVFFPGGFGTLDEAFELLTLVQTGKCDPIPLIFIDTPGAHFWDSLQDFIHNRLLKNRKISPEDLHLYKVTDSIDEAIQEIVQFYSNYHSLRFVKDDLVFRLHRPVDAGQLKYLNKHFRDILASGKFRKSGPLEEEANQPELADMPRLVFRFNRVNNGRLRQLIDYLNQH